MPKKPAKPKRTPKRPSTTSSAARMFHPQRELAFDFRRPVASYEERYAAGRALRAETRRARHAEYSPASDRPDPVDLLLATAAGRQEHLLPLRHARMAESPFAFLRGAAAVMAWDLAGTPSTGLPVVICGDAHVNNFGLYGNAQRQVVFDMNDFDETTIGPWEWDLKRLTASVNVMAREIGLDRGQRRAAVMLCSLGYRTNIRRLARMGVLDLFSTQAAVERVDVGVIEREFPSVAKAWPKAEAVLDQVADKARRSDSRKLLQSAAEQRADGTWRFREDPPILTSVEPSVREDLIAALNAYWHRLPIERRWMLKRYQLVDVAHRVVGVGSVGMRAYVAMFLANGVEDPLFLQVKEATAPAHAPYLPRLPSEQHHEGVRVVSGQAVLQAVYDPLLGPAEMDGRYYFVRQWKNLKASLPTQSLSGLAFDFFVYAFGALLARAHARTGDPAAIAGYCGKSQVLDDALSEWAEAYGKQTVKDHATLVAAIDSGRVAAAAA